MSCERTVEWSTHSHPTLLRAELTPFFTRFILWNAASHRSIWRGDGRQRPLLKLTLCVPGCQIQTDTSTHACGACSRLDCAAQSEWIRNRLIMTGFRVGMTKHLPQLNKSHCCKIWASNQQDGRFSVLRTLTLRCTPSMFVQLWLATFFSYQVNLFQHLKYEIHFWQVNPHHKPQEVSFFLQINNYDWVYNKKWCFDKCWWLLHFLWPTNKMGKE